MKAVLLSLGTRGDIEPFLAVAEKLKRSGCDVVCSFPMQFQTYVDETKYKFYGLSEKFLEVIEGEKAKLLIGGKGNLFQKVSAMIWILKNARPMQKEVIVQQHDIIEAEQPDIIVYNQKCLYPAVWGLKHNGKTTLLSPLPCTIHEYDRHASLGMGNDLGSFLNKLTYRFSNFFLFLTIKSSTKKYHRELGLKINLATIKSHILKKEKTIYTISPNLFTRPSDWGAHVRVVGYHEKASGSDWEPAQELLAFIEKYERIIFITFGSMLNPNPQRNTNDILSVLVKHHVPAVINTASGGLIRPERKPDHLFFTDSIPYEWILPKMYAAVHHGGSGTTHMTIKYGCACLIIPHILDQYVWNELLSELGVGPKGFSMKKFSARRFEEKLLDLLHIEEYKNNAVRIGNEMQKEQFEDYLIDTILN
ncbi:MAG: glycosyltransferase [Cytophagales bacterium]|nr:glycosyltransferase [Cytophagales bacterium]